MDKEAVYLLIMTDMSKYATQFEFGYYRRLELLSLLFIVNGPNRIHTVLTTWMKKDFCPKGLLPCAFMSACCDMFGSTRSSPVNSHNIYIHLETNKKIFRLVYYSLCHKEEYYY